MNMHVVDEKTRENSSWRQDRTDERKEVGLLHIVGKSTYNEREKERQSTEKK